MPTRPFQPSYAPLHMATLYTHTLANKPEPCMDVNAWKLVASPERDGRASLDAQDLPIFPDRARECTALRDALVQTLQNKPSQDAFSHLESVMSTAYTTIFSPFQHDASQKDTQVGAAILSFLGLTSEALVHINTQESFVIALKLLVYAQQHIGTIPGVHFRRIAADLGQRGQTDHVLQLVRLAQIHHEDDWALWYAKFLALNSLHNVKFSTYWSSTVKKSSGEVPYEAYELCMLHCASHRSHHMYRRALKGLLKSHHTLRSRTWLALFETYPPLTAIVSKEYAHLIKMDPAAMIPALLQKLIAHNAVHYIPWILWTVRVPESHRLVREQKKVPLWSHETHHLIPTWEPCATTYSLAATCAGRQGRPDVAIRFFKLALKCAAHDRPMAATERQPEAERHPDAVAMEYACVGVVNAFLRADKPGLGIAFAQHVTGVDLGILNPRGFNVSKRCTTLSTMLVASLIKCAGRLYNIRLLVIVLDRAQDLKLRINGRVRRALAALIMECLDPRSKNLGLMYKLLSFLDKPSSSQSLLGKLRAELASMGFDYCMQRAKPMHMSHMSRALPSPESQSLTWVRDTPLQPEAEPSMSKMVSPTTVPAAPRARTQYLHLLLKTKDKETVQRTFRTFLEANQAPSRRHVELLLSALCNTQQMNEAWWILRRGLEIWNMRPHANMYEAVSSAYAQMGDWQSVSRVLRHMERNHIEVDMYLYDKLQMCATSNELNSLNIVPTKSLDMTRHKHVLQHFVLLMRQHKYLEAQQFAAEYLATVKKPGGMWRRAIRDARYRISRAGDIKALILCKENIRRSKDRDQEKRKERSFRYNLIHLVRRILRGYPQATR